MPDPEARITIVDATGADDIAAAGVQDNDPMPDDLSGAGESPPQSGLPRVRDLDPVPWTGTAAPGNTGRPYGELQSLTVPQRAPAAAPTPSAPAAPTGWGPPRAPATGPAYLRGGPQPTGPGSSAEAASADRSGRRALRTAIAGAVLGFIGFALGTGAQAVAGLALVLSAVAGVVAFITGIGAVRRARRARISSARGGVAIAFGAVGVCMILFVGGVFIAFRSEIGQAVTCSQNAGGSRPATQQCTQTLLDSMQKRLNR